MLCKVFIPKHTWLGSSNFWQRHPHKNAEDAWSSNALYLADYVWRDVFCFRPRQHACTCQESV